jgi:phosphatidylglycerophosphate synthase
MKHIFYLINAITVYRLLSAPILIILAITHQIEIFRWMLPVSFLTDAIDGPLARKFKVASIKGAKLDSISDDLTVLAGIFGLFMFETEFLLQQIVPVIILLLLFVVQVSFAFFKFGKMTSFHTYAAKLAAVCQGVFLILAFFLQEPSVFLFYTAIIITAFDLIEEIVLVLVLPKWCANVKGLYWVLKGNSSKLI